MKCPCCGADIRWDWCQDIYIINGKEADSEIINTENHDTFPFSNEATIEVVLCQCKSVIGIIISDPEYGCDVFNSEQYNVDWEDEGNVFRKEG